MPMVIALTGKRREAETVRAVTSDLNAVVAHALRQPVHIEDAP
jgi:hypothetical protein